MKICQTTMVMMMVRMVMMMTMKMNRQIFMTSFHEKIVKVKQNSSSTTEIFLYEHFTSLATSQ